MTGPADTYAAITREVQALIESHAENDRRRAAYMVARAALVCIGNLRGNTEAARTAYGIADEMATSP